MDRQDGQFERRPCFICGQEVKGKVFGPAKAEGPMCGRECARAYFIGLQVASVRGAIIGMITAAEQQAGSGLVTPR